jgi:F-type H+/Na+-transporting ATPase subunit alpha
MKDFNYFLDKIGEIGFVDEILHSVAYVSGLPKAHPGELVIFEGGDFGEVFSLNEEYVEILLFSNSNLNVGQKVVRTDELLNAPVGNGVLGRMINPMGIPIDDKGELKNVILLPIDREPPKIMERKQVDKPLETGVTLVDLAVPLGRGQRELVIGDRKTGKTEFILQTILYQAAKGTVCIYGVIGQKKVDILKLSEFFESKGIKNNTVIIASSSADTGGLVYLTPYTAMTIAEHFKDQGMDVLLILDDMTTHARVYREICLLARRFPGRNSYPGDIFYLHAKLIERAGNFKKGSITALPVAESVFGDLSGYVQTNLMAMTDGHIFFDIDLYNEGKRPAVNPFLSVTRVGRQTQSKLLKDISREVNSFLITYDRMKQFMHFGAEVGQTAKNILSLGMKIDLFFNQPDFSMTNLNISVLILSGLWAGIWAETNLPDLKRLMEKVTLSYNTNETYQKEVDTLITGSKSFSDLVTYLRRQGDIITKVR